MRGIDGEGKTQKGLRTTNILYYLRRVMIFSHFYFSLTFKLNLHKLFIMNSSYQLEVDKKDDVKEYFSI